MQFDFTSIIDRHGHDSLAMDGLGDGTGFSPAKPREGFDSIPLWIADMGFATAPSVVEAMRARLDHPVFGYYAPSDAYFQAIIEWHRTHKGVDDILPEHIGYENGVLGCVASAMQAFTAPGEKFLLHSPTYIGFTHVLEDNGRTAELSPLVKDENGIWRMDYEDME